MSMDNEKMSKGKSDASLALLTFQGTVLLAFQLLGGCKKPFTYITEKIREMQPKNQNFF